MEFSIAAGRAVLARTPVTLRAMLQGLPDEWLYATEGPDTWSPYDILGHLVHGERTDWIARARIVLAQGEDRRFVPFDRVAMLQEPRRPVADLLDEFAVLRLRNLEALDGLRVTTEQLDLEGIHPDFGPVTLRQLLSAWVTHDLGHVAQVARVMAKQYREAIGPWRAYLPIVDR